MSARLKHRNAGISVNYTTRDENAQVPNRKGRRAAKSKAGQTGLFPDSTLPVFDETKWRAGYEKRRAAREAFWATQTEADIQAIALRKSASVGFDTTLVALLMVAVPGWVERHAKTDPDARVKRAHELGELIAYDQGSAALADPDARGTEKQGALADVFNAIAEGLAIGAFCPGGATFVGVNWAVVGSELRITHLDFCHRHTIGAAA